MTRWLKKVEHAITQLKTDVRRMEASALERCCAAQLAATAAINGYLQAITAAAEVTSTPNCSLVQSEDVNLAHNYDTDQAYLPRQGPVSVIWDGGANSKCASANFDKEYNLPTRSKFSVHLEYNVGVDGPAGGSGLEHLGDGGANDPPRNTGAAGVDTSALHLVRSAEIIVGGSGVNNSLLHSEDVDMPVGGNGYDEGAGVQLPNSVYMPADGSGYDEGAGVQLPSSIDMPAGGGDYDEGAGVQLPVSVNYAIVSGGDLGGGSGVTRGPAHVVVGGGDLGGGSGVTRGPAHVVVGGGDLGHGGSAAALEPVHADDDVWLSDPQAGGPDPGGGSTLNSNFVCPVPLVDVKGYGRPAVTLFDSGTNSVFIANAPPLVMSSGIVLGGSGTNDPLLNTGVAGVVPDPGHLRIGVDGSGEALPNFIVVANAPPLVMSSGIMLGGSGANDPLLDTGVAGVEHCAADGVDGGDEVLPDVAGGGSGEMNSLLPGEDNKAVLYSDVVAHALPLDDVADHAIAGAVDGVVSGGGDLGHSGNDATLKPAFEPVHGGDVWDPVPQAGGLDPGGGDDVVE